MKEEKIPKLVNDRVDLKALTIETLQTTFEVINKGDIEGINSSDTMELVLITNFGYVTGEYVNIAEASEIPEDGKNFNRYLYASSITHRNSRLASYEEENENLRLTSDSSLIYLKNAKVRPFSNPQSTITFGDFFLFTDQVVGVSGKGSSE